MGGVRTVRLRPGPRSRVRPPDAVSPLRGSAGPGLPVEGAVGRAEPGLAWPGLAAPLPPLPPLGRLASSVARERR